MQLRYSSFAGAAEVLLHFPQLSLAAEGEIIPAHTGLLVDAGGLIIIPVNEVH